MFKNFNLVAPRETFGGLGVERGLPNVNTAIYSFNNFFAQQELTHLLLKKTKVEFLILVVGYPGKVSVRRRFIVKVMVPLRTLAGRPSYEL